MRFGIRLLVFCFAVAPFTWVMVTRVQEQLEGNGLSVGTGALAVVMVLLSAGYVYSIVESLYNIVLDAKDAAHDAKVEQAQAATRAEQTHPPQKPGD